MFRWQENPTRRTNTASSGLCKRPQPQAAWKPKSIESNKSIKRFGSPRRNVPQEEATPRRLGPEMQETSAASNMETQINCVQTKYQKGVGLVLVGDGTCPVCLDEFEEGEYLRTLPECSHSFHVPCIDMWLYSQPSCPVCRANAKQVTVAVKQ
ncbi:hypothetical protein DVH24_024124 [Malus domestica]|uniref:RING-type domain-containing protein n=1 Tax=Malus domestica TaxID=3750 RepID=A0A498JFX5_MALDO|nr:hypothetical protein DVH24_024124 [Malus domestica]